MFSRPRRVPASAVLVAWYRNGTGAHSLSSFRRGMRRAICRPHTCEGALLKRIVLNGIWYSATQPCSLIRVLTSHTPSQSTFDELFEDNWLSRFAPAGLTD